jgi:hypothetical protein
MALLPFARHFVEPFVYIAASPHIRTMRTMCHDGECPQGRFREVSHESHAKYDMLRDHNLQAVCCNRADEDRTVGASEKSRRLSAQTPSTQTNAAPSRVDACRQHGRGPRVSFNIHKALTRIVDSTRLAERRIESPP